jgi:hydrophobe/amphiphile efflux-3 (HAE3) family protein
VSLSAILRVVMGAAARRPVLVGLATGVLAVAGGALALRLEPTAGTDTLVGRGTPSYAATQRLHERFGDEAVLVLVREPVTRLVLTSDLGRLLGLEGCLSGRRPRGAPVPGGPRGPCARLAATRPARVVFGPATFINEAAGQINDRFDAELRARALQGERAARAARQLARKRGRSAAEARRLGEQARQLVYAQFLRDTYRLALRYGLRSRPDISDPTFVDRIVFSDSAPPGTPKQRFAYLFPNRDSALVQVRLRPQLGEAERRRAIDLIRDAVAMRQWRLTNGGGSYVVTGAPVVAGELTTALGGSVLRLLAAALVVMALTLALVFRSRLRLLPLAVAVAAAALTFGALSAAGASLTMASVGVLPVLIGLAVDYAIQLQSRITEERSAAPAGDMQDAIDRAARGGAPTVALAAAATAAGFGVLVLSPVPMVRGFGLLLVAGIVLALGCALTLGSAVLAWTDRRRLRRPRRGRAAALGAAAADAVLAAWRGAGELLVGSRAARAVGRRAAAAGRGAFAAATGRPARVVAFAATVAAVGWALDTRTHVESDIEKLVPQDLGGLRDLRSLQRSTGVGGQVDVVVTGDDLAEPAVVRWMTRYQRDVLRRFGYSARRGCGEADLCPALSLPDLFAGGAARSRAQVERLLDAVPPYFSQGVITPDRRTATLAFGVRLMSLKRQQEVFRELRRRLDPPEGVRAQLAGLPVLAAEANDRISSPWRRLGTLVAGLAAVALVLFAALRRWERALVPLVPIALATGWSALVLFALRVPLNPMSVTLGVLVLAITTEFSVLLSERYREEREAGHAPRAALAQTFRSTGAAVAASGVTAIAGFAVLVLSDVRMLRDFGLVTIVDLSVSLAGVLLVLPAVLLLAEDRRLRVPVPSLRRPRLRRRAAGVDRPVAG